MNKESIDICELVVRIFEEAQILGRKKSIYRLYLNGVFNSKTKIEEKYIFKIHVQLYHARLNRREILKS